MMSDVFDVPCSGSVRTVSLPTLWHHVDSFDKLAMSSGMFIYASNYAQLNPTVNTTRSFEASNLALCLSTRCEFGSQVLSLVQDQ